MEYQANISSRNTSQDRWDDIVMDSDSDENNNSGDERQISDGLPIKILINTQNREQVQAEVHNEDPEPPIIPPHDGNGFEESGNTKKQRAAQTAHVQAQLAASTGPQVVPPFQTAVSYF